MVTLFLRIFVPFEECIQVWCQSLFIDIINKSIRLWIALLQLHAPFDDVKKYLSRNMIHFEKIWNRPVKTIEIILNWYRIFDDYIKLRAYCNMSVK